MLRKLILLILLSIWGLDTANAFEKDKEYELETLYCNESGQLVQVMNLANTRKYSQDQVITNMNAEYKNQENACGVTKFIIKFIKKSSSYIVNSTLFNIWKVQVLGYVTGFIPPNPLMPKGYYMRQYFKEMKDQYIIHKAPGQPT